MKTKIFAMLFAGAMAAGMASCDLDPKVYSSMTDDNFPKTVTDADALLTGLYANIKNNSGGMDDRFANGAWGWPVWSIGGAGWYGYNEITTDEAYYLNETRYRDFTWGAADNSMQTYQLNRNITRATRLIDVLEKLQFDDARKKRMIAEAKCIRAHIMFALYDMYGPVPMTIDPEKAQDVKYEPRPTKEEYFNHMVYAEALKDMGYTLSADYFEPFRNETSNETIWAIPSGSISDNEFFFYTIPSDCNEVCGLEVAPYWGVFTMTWSFYDTFTSGDVRKKGIAPTYKQYVKNSQTGRMDTVLHTRYNNPGERLQYGPLVVKYFIDKQLSSSGRFHQVCFRYADVILSLAEIENELNGPTNKALDYLKQITDRAQTTATIPSDIQASKDNFREFLLAERGRELYLEGWRREDLIRFGKFISNARTRGKDAKDYQVLLPIPSKVITQSGGIVKQNPGYE